MSQAAKFSHLCFVLFDCFHTSRMLNLQDFLVTPMLGKVFWGVGIWSPRLPECLKVAGQKR